MKIQIFMGICLISVLTGCATVKVEPTPSPKQEYHSPWMTDDVYVDNTQVILFPYRLTF